MYFRKINYTLRLRQNDSGDIYNNNGTIILELMINKINTNNLTGIKNLVSDDSIKISKNFFFISRRVNLTWKTIFFFF